MNLSPDLTSGTLSDKHIRQGSEQGFLISAEFDESRLKQACYELRAGRVYYELDGVSSTTKEIRHELAGPAEYILLKPRQFICIITLETLRLPANILGRILTKGQLFSVGIIPVNTYADPGFEGNLGIVLTNLSNNYLRIKQSDPIAKIEFSKLRQSVEKPYVGQHGFQTNFWPIPSQMILTEAEIQADPRIKKPLEELERVSGRLFAEVTKKVFSYHRYLILATVFYVILSTLLVGVLVAREPAGFTLQSVVALGLGVLSNVLFALLTFVATWSTRKN